MVSQATFPPSLRWWNKPHNKADLEHNHRPPQLPAHPIQNNFMILGFLFSALAPSGDAVATGARDKSFKIWKVWEGRKWEVGVLRRDLGRKGVGRVMGGQIQLLEGILSFK